MTKYRLRIPAPCGQLELVALDPVEGRRGIALIAHPHSLYGGSLENKVVETLAKTMADLDFVAVRFNFRGVGESSGTFDEGNGETEDVKAVFEFVRKQYEAEDLPVVLIGFSFGAYVMSRVAKELPHDRLILVAPATNMFTFGSVPPETLIIHGEQDDLVPLSLVKAWADPYGYQIEVIPGADHFFNQSLDRLRQIVVAAQCQI